MWVSLASFTANIRDYLDSLEEKFPEIGNNILLNNTAAYTPQYDISVYLCVLLFLLVFALALRVLLLELGLVRPSQNGGVVLWVSLIVVGFVVSILSLGLYLLQQSLEPQESLVLASLA